MQQHRSTNSADLYTQSQSPIDAMKTRVAHPLKPLPREADQTDRGWGKGPFAAGVAGMETLVFDQPLVTLGSLPFPEEPWWKRISPSSIFALASTVIALWMLISELLGAHAPGFPIDEAWLHQVYARNFFQHVAFEFNIGEHTPGPTAPFWTVVLAIILRLAHDPYVCAKLLGTFFLSLTGFYSFRALRAARFDYGSAVLGGLLALSVGRLAWASLSGMESTMSAALVMAAIWTYFARPNPSGRVQTGVVFALAVLARPEAALVLVLVLLERFIDRKSDHDHLHATRHAWRDIALIAVPFVIVLIPIALTNVALSAEVMPQTFLAGLRTSSVLVMMWHGDVLGIAQRLIQSALELRFAFGGIYLADNPFLVIAIVWASVIYWKHERVRQDPGARLLRFSLLLLIGVPYLRSLVLGMDAEFGEHARWLHFLSPIFIIAGLSALRILVIHYVLRGPTSRQVILSGAGMALVSGFVMLLFGDALTSTVNHWANAIVYPDLLSSRPATVHTAISLSAVFPFLLLLATTAAFRYCRINPFKRDIPLFVSEEERRDIKFEIVQEDDEHEIAMSDHVIRLLRGVLLIALVWNITSIIRAGSEFGEEVRLQNAIVSAMSKSIMERTQPDDVIASNEIGAIGFATSRKILDTEGNISIESNHNQRTYGKAGGLLRTLAEKKPLYFAAFGSEYHDVIAANPALFERVAGVREGPLEAVLFKLKY